MPSILADGSRGVKALSALNTVRPLTNVPDDRIQTTLRVWTPAVRTYVKLCHSDRQALALPNARDTLCTSYGNGDEAMEMKKTLT